MRDASSDDGYSLSEPGDIEPSDNDSSGVDVELDSDIDVGFDFLEDMEPDLGTSPGQPTDVEPASETTRATPTESQGGITQDDVTDFRVRWADIQASFIDDPRRACEQADNLVDVVLKRITDYFARGRDDLVRRWDRGNEPTSTEDLRMALKGYRGLIDRLLETEL
jgi:hypothetical protein